MHTILQPVSPYTVVLYNHTSRQILISEISTQFITEKVQGGVHLLEGKI